MFSFAVKNGLFLILQITLLTAYLSLKNGKIINVFEGFFGLGDFLFLLAICFGLSFFNYVVFYILSLLMVIGLHILGVDKSVRGEFKIPLAGYQALMFLVLLACSWLLPTFSLTNDLFLVNMLGYGS